MPPEPRFCSSCGGSIRASPGRFDCNRCHRRQWVNSKPATGALVMRDGRLLLVRRRHEPFRGWWDIPGGFLDAGEHPEAGVVREVDEETGLAVRPDRLIGIYMDRYGEGGDFTLNLYYECTVIGGTERAGDDAVEIGWFPRSAVPENVAFENGRAVLRDWLGQTGCATR